MLLNSGKVDLVDIFIKEELDVNSKDKNGVTPLIDACHKGQKDIVQYLLKNGAYINATTCRGRTVLHFATESRQVDLVDNLIKKDWMSILKTRIT